MYIPPAHAEPDPAVADALIAAHGFALLVSAGADGPTASHLPLELDRARRVLMGHMARANPHWQELEGATALAVFSGPHAFVSPRWYATGPAVPTWNYEAVHVTGRARLVEDPAELRAVLRRLSRRYDPEWDMDALPPDYLDRMVRGVVGVEIAVLRIETKRKLSQNRSAEDIAGVATALAAGGEMERAVARAMREAER